MRPVGNQTKKPFENPFDIMVTPGNRDNWHLEHRCVLFARRCTSAGHSTSTAPPLSELETHPLQAAAGAMEFVQG